MTGPTSGIGREFALQLAGRGYDLVLVARDEERLEQVARSVRNLGATAETIVADLSDRSQYGAVEARIGAGLDLLVNNAGFGHKTTFLETSADDEIAMLDVLVTAVLRFTHAALGMMTTRGHGGIINVSSVAGEVPGGSYSAAKAYVTNFSEWADVTYRKQGVRVMALLPGFTRTEFHQRKGGGGPAQNWLWLDAAALVRAALDDFDKGKVQSVPSARYKVTVFGARYAPAPLRRLAHRRRA